MQAITIKEHESISSVDAENLKNLGWRPNPETNFMKPPRFLNIAFNPRGELKASYYIGACHLVENEFAAVVEPKEIGGTKTDFVKMFLDALKIDSHREADYFSKCYGIDIDAPKIEANAFDSVLSPLLLCHYVALLENLAKHGLKRGYVVREENLKSKVKGRILFGQNLRKNVFLAREDCVFCRYSERTADIPENRLLKKALLFADRMLKSFASFEGKRAEIRPRVNRLLATFAEVSDEISVSAVKTFRANKLFSEYADAIRVAKMILRFNDYSIENAGGRQKSVPPFWIDMARLYEMFVYGKLFDAYGDEIKFQVKGFYNTAADFIKKGKEKWIIDAKYKPKYANSNACIIDDIREISGYARDKKILEKLGVDENSNEKVKCLIVYPEPQNLEYDDGTKDDCHTFAENEKIDFSKASEIKPFRNFYKISVPLPPVSTK